MSGNRSREIIDFAHDIRNNWGKDPFVIAEKLGIKVVYSNIKNGSSYFIKASGYPAIINIAGADNETAAKCICAHELGHALLHGDGINYLDGTIASIKDNTEYEANLFAVALLVTPEKLSMPLESMNNYMLREILKANI